MFKATCFLFSSPVNRKHDGANDADGRDRVARRRGLGVAVGSDRGGRAARAARGESSGHRRDSNRGPARRLQANRHASCHDGVSHDFIHNYRTGHFQSTGASVRE